MAFLFADISELLAARVQMGFTLGFHIIVASLGVGMPALMLIAEWRYLRTADEGWRTLARRWSKAFAVLFAVGAVSGTVLSFELGLLWPEFMATFGAVISLPFMLEAIAFFLEAIFLGIYLYSWDRLSPRAHWWSGVPIVLGGVASAWFVVTANAWMNVPQGFRLEDGVVVDADPIAAMLNPATGAQTTHMMVAAYMVTGFVVAAFYAFELLRGRNTLYQRRAMMLGLVVGAALAPVQAVVGHWAAQVVAATQPVKLAAMEGQFRTEASAPLRLGGIPDEKARMTRYAVEIPGGLSWLAYGDPAATVRGLDDFPRKNSPPMVWTHIAFQVMVGIGMALIAFTPLALWAAWRTERFSANRWFLRATIPTGPLAVIALEAGWIVTEVGRQPWIVQGVMRTEDAVTAAPGIGWLLLITAIIYAVLAIACVVVLRLLARAPFATSAGSDR
jgi:cytochrome d ubiquinol oxidase subunit I